MTTNAALPNSSHERAQRCLWTAILAHGLIDTTGVMIIYLGLEG